MAKVKGLKQVWFVSVIGVEQDGNKPTLFPEQSQAQVEEEVQPARPRGRNELNIGVPSPTSNDFGFHLMRNSVITLGWNTKQAAQAYAKEQAAKNPKTAYGVFGCSDVFETTAPEIIEKQFNDAGELVVVPKVGEQNV